MSAWITAHALLTGLCLGSAVASWRAARRAEGFRAWADASNAELVRRLEAAAVKLRETAEVVARAAR